MLRSGDGIEAIMPIQKTTEELEQSFGHQIRTLRLRQNLDQISLAKQAGVALSALKNLESGKGSTLRTFLKVLKSLGRIEWLETLAPVVSISPLQILKQKSERKRASRPRSGKS